MWIYLLHRQIRLVPLIISRLLFFLLTCDSKLTCSNHADKMIRQHLDLCGSEDIDQLHFLCSAEYRKSSKSCRCLLMIEEINNVVYSEYFFLVLSLESSQPFYLFKSCDIFLGIFLSLFLLLSHLITIEP